MSKARTLAYTWVAVALAALAWFGSQQLGSNLSFADCAANGPLETGLIGLVALAVALGGGLLSRRVWKKRDPGAEGQGFAALVGMLVSALLAVAIAFQTAAAFIIPECFA